MEDEDEGHGDVAKALMTMAIGKKETGLHMRFNSRSQNGTRQIRSGNDLAEFIEGVHEGWQHAKVTMHSQFTRKMHKGGCTRDSIELCLQQGVLLRIITDTYAWYSYVLTALAGHVSKLTPGELWGDSVAGNLLKTHEKELFKHFFLDWGTGAEHT